MFKPSSWKHPESFPVIPRHPTSPQSALQAVSVRCCAPIMGMKLKLDPSLSVAYVAYGVANPEKRSERVSKYYDAWWI